MAKPSRPRFKYNEMRIIAEVTEYILSTYKGHYTNKDGVQVLDLLFASGVGIPYCAGNGIKYLSRMGKKGKNTERQDVMKTIHYCILLLYLLDENAV
jgi:hypothetical protein